MTSPYQTSSASYEAWVMRNFAELLRNGAVYRGPRPVYWSIKEQRIMGQEQIEEKSELTISHAVKFPIIGFKSKAAHLANEYPNLSLLVFVKQPWKLCGTKAVAVNKDLQYSIVKKGQENIIIASQRLGQFMIRLGDIDHFLGPHGSTLERGLILQNPVTQEEIEVCNDSSVSANIGTGAGLVCPGHQVEGLRLSSAQNLSREGCLSNQGIIISGGERFQGKFYEIEGNAQIIRVLKQKNAILASYDYHLSYQYSKILEQKAILLSIDAWYLHISEMMKSDVQRMINQVKFTPSLDSAKKLYYTMKEEVELMEDWCISQNNAWGIPVPAFTSSHSEKQVLTSPQIVENVAQIVEREGSDVWFEKPASYFLSTDLVDKFSEIEKKYEVFECWFDSALSWSFLN